MSAPLLASPVASADTGSAWDRLAQCESSGNWAINTGNGFSGGLQFTPGTWRSFGGPGVAHQASREQQIAVAERILAVQGWGAWPACSRKLGLRGTPAPVRVAPQARPSTTVAAAPSSVAPAPTASSASSASSASGRTVHVVAGDTLSRIAAVNGVAGGWQAVRAANPALGNPNRLSIGAVIALP